MATEFKLQARSREVKGKGASRRLRRLAHEVPAIVYGSEKAPQNISLSHKDVAKALENEAFYSHIIGLEVDGKSEDVILKDVQRHPAKLLILHLDFMRVSKTKKLQTRVPLHFLNEETCVGVKQSGGIVSHSLTELEVQCLPQDLPEYIEVDMAAVDIGDMVHISDLKLPAGVESTDLLHGEEHDLPVATVIKPRAVIEEDEEAADTEAGADVTADDAGEEEQDQD